MKLDLNDYMLRSMKHSPIQLRRPWSHVVAHRWEEPVRHLADADLRATSSGGCGTARPGTLRQRKVVKTFIVEPWQFKE